jgi:hypothetical protein
LKTSSCDALAPTITKNLQLPRSSNPRPSHCPIPSFSRSSRAQTPRRCQDIPGSILLRATTTSTTHHLHILKHPLLGHPRRRNHLPSPRSTSLPSPNYNASKLLSQSPSTTVFSPLRRHPLSRKHSPRTRRSVKQLPKKLKSPRPARVNLRAKVSTTESRLRHTRKDPALLTPSPTSWPPQEVRRASSHKCNKHQAHRSTRWEVRCTKSPSRCKEGADFGIAGDVGADEHITLDLRFDFRYPRFET